MKATSPSMRQSFSLPKKVSYLIIVSSVDLTYWCEKNKTMSSAAP
jgi:hypothetical protein